MTKSAFGANQIGSVFVQGKWWNARMTSGDVAANTPVRVLAREGMTLIVSPTQDSPVAIAQLTHSNE